MALIVRFGNYDISAVDAGADTFGVAGDKTSDFVDGDRFVVEGSTGNDGIYTCNGNSTHAGGTTTITVDQDITDGTADGYIEGAEKLSNVISCHAEEIAENGQVGTAEIVFVDESKAVTVTTADAIGILLDNSYLWRGEVAGPPEQRQIADDTMAEVIFARAYGKLLEETIVDEREFVQSWPIIDANTVQNQIRIEGDHTATFVDDYEFLIRDSTGNDDTHTCDGDGVLDNGQTLITVDNPPGISDGTNDGLVVEIKGDDAIIDDLFDDREQDDIDDTTYVDQVFSQFENGITLGNSTLAEAMDKIAGMTGARWWITKHKYLYYKSTPDAETNDLSTDPGDVGGTTYRAYDLKIENEHTLINRVYVVGKANDGTVISAWVEDAASVASYGKREALLIDASINTTDGLDDAGNKIINDNKDPSTSVTLKTMQDDFTAGYTVDVTSSDHGLSAETLFIRRVEMDLCRRDGSDDVEYTLHLGDPQWTEGAYKTGVNRRIRTLENNQVATTGSGGSSGSGSSSAEYLTLALTSNLSAERQFVAGVGLDGTDAGANSTYTLDIDVGIDDDDIVQMDDADAADNDYARFTANGLEGRSYAEMVDTDLAEEIQDLVGAMATGNTETFITVTYQDGDGTMDFVVPVKDEDDMASDSDTFLATQQSIKAYVDDNAGGASAIDDLSDVTITGPADNDLLQYDNGSSQWVDRTLAEAGVASTAHKDTHDPQDGADALDCAAAGTISPDDSAAEGTAHSFARSDHVHEIACDVAAEISTVTAAGEGSASYFARSDHVHAISHAISDNHIVTMDDADAAADDWARFTANGLAGYSDAELLGALDGDAAAAFDWNGQNITNLGNVYVADGGTVGVSGGVLWTFDNTNSEIEASHTVIGTTDRTENLGKSDLWWNAAYIDELHTGTIKTFVFEADVVNVFNSSSLIAKSSAPLAQDETLAANDAADTIKVTDTGRFEVDDIVRLKDVDSDSFALVTGIGSDPTIDITVKSGGGESFDSGTPVVNYGPSGQGLMVLTAEDLDLGDGTTTYGPSISIFSHAGEPWSSVTEYGRLGNMNSAFGVGANDYYGFGFGDYSSGNYVLYEHNGGFSLSAGNGAIAIDSTGIRVTASTELADLRSYKFTNSDGSTVYGGLYSRVDGNITTTVVNASNTAGDNVVSIGSTDYAEFVVNDTSNVSRAWLNASGGHSFDIIYDDTTYFTVAASDGDTRIAAGLFVGAVDTDPAAGTVQIHQDSGDPLLIFDIGDTDKFTVGVDDSDSDKFKIDSGGALTDTSLLELDSSGNIAIGGTATITSTLILSTVAAAGTDTDKFLVLDGSDNVDYRTGAQLLADMSGDAGAAFDFNGQDVTVANLIIADAGNIGSTSDTDAIAIAGDGSVTLSVQQIADNHVLTVDDADAADDDYARFTANGLEGRSYSDVRGDLSLATTDDVTFDDLRLSSGLYVGATGTEPDSGVITVYSGSTTWAAIVLDTDYDSGDTWKIRSRADNGALDFRNEDETDNVLTLAADGSATVSGCITDGTCEIFTEDALAIIADIMAHGDGTFDEHGHEHQDMRYIYERYPYLIKHYDARYYDRLGAKSDLLYRATMQQQEIIMALAAEVARVMKNDE